MVEGVVQPEHVSIREENLYERLFRKSFNYMMDEQTRDLRTENELKNFLRNFARKLGQLPNLSFIVVRKQMPVEIINPMMSKVRRRGNDPKSTILSQNDENLEEFSFENRSNTNDLISWKTIFITSIRN